MQQDTDHARRRPVVSVLLQLDFCIGDLRYHHPSGEDLSLQTPVLIPSHLSFPNSTAQVLLANLCSCYAPLTGSKNLYRFSVCSPSNMGAIHVVVLGCNRYYFCVHRYSTFSGSSSSGFCTQVQEIILIVPYKFLQALYLDTLHSIVPLNHAHATSCSRIH